MLRNAPRPRGVVPALLELTLQLSLALLSGRRGFLLFLISEVTKTKQNRPETPDCWRAYASLCSSRGPCVDRVLRLDAGVWSLDLRAWCSSSGHSLPLNLGLYGSVWFQMTDRIQVNFVYMVIVKVSVVGSEGFLLKWPGLICHLDTVLVSGKSSLKVLEILGEL